MKAREVNAMKKQAAKVGEVPAETKPVSIPDIARAIKMNDGTVGLIVRILNLFCTHPCKIAIIFLCG